MSVRHATAAALLAAAVLTLTACGPDETPASASSSAPAEPAAGQTTGPAAKPTAKPSARPTDCPAPAAGHLAIHVDDVNGAMNHVEAHVATLDCSPGRPGGPSWVPTARTVEYTFATTAKTEILYAPDGLRTVSWDTALRHVQSCAAPDRFPTPKGEECMGNFYDVQVDSGNRITELTQLHQV